MQGPVDWLVSLLGVWGRQRQRTKGFAGCPGPCCSTSATRATAAARAAAIAAPRAAAGRPPATSGPARAALRLEDDGVRAVEVRAGRRRHAPILRAASA